MELRNEILDDYIDYCSQKLISEFGQYDSSNYDPIYLYQRYKCRIIGKHVRAVNAALSLIIPEQHDEVYRTIISDISRGGDLRKYQSRKLKTLDYDDDMLSHWGIQHLHFGRNLENDGFVNRTSELLFVHFTNTAANIIGVFNHSSWCDLDMIEIMHENWPQELAIYKNRSDSRKLTVNEYQVLRKKNSNANIIVNDGTEYLCPGLGVTANGSPINAVFNSDKIIYLFKRHFEVIEENIERIVESDPERRESEILTIGIEIDHGSKDFVFKIKETGFEFMLAS